MKLFQSLQEDYFKLDTEERIAEILNNKLRFFFIGSPHYNGRHYYRVENGEVLIECENYGNHTYHLWRSTNDFGMNSIK